MPGAICSAGTSVGIVKTKRDRRTCPRDAGAGAGVAADIERLPLIFNSEIDGHRYGHIVLAVRYGGRVGALGLSRRPNLMYKPCEFETLADLVADYKVGAAHGIRVCRRSLLADAGTLPLPNVLRLPRRSRWHLPVPL